MRTSEEIRDLYIKFFQSKNHKEIQNASLVPLNDPTILFTTAGMHPLVPYLLGQPHPQGKRLVNVQRCLRTNDIEEVGDTTHLTFFEMLGYWSLGDYFKEEAIRFTFEFFTSKEYMGLDPKRLYASVFEGDKDAPKDNTSIKAWQEVFKSVGINAKVFDGNNHTDPDVRIFPLDKKENWWGPAGQTGPCGPDSELFYWRGEEEPDLKKFVPWDSSEMFIEISNDVFMQYNKTEEGNFEPLENNNVDFGSGFERVVMIEQFKDENGAFPLSVSLYDTDLFTDTLNLIEKLSGKKYNPKANESEETKAFRIVAEHARSTVFILADGVIPGSKDQGYILRRLVRRMVRYGMKLGIEGNFIKDLAEVVIAKMKRAYPHLDENKSTIINELEKEEIKFRKTIDRGLKEMRKMIDSEEELNGAKAFFIYETFGFPLELTLEEFNLSEERVEQITKEFEEEKEKHAQQSRKGAEQKFKGGLADNSVEVTKLHTTHHLLLRALQIVLGDHVHQRGSNITAERLRIDFSHGEKLTEDQVKQVEEIVNKAIEDELNVVRVEMPKDEAEKIGAEMEFGQKYPDVVSVYFIGNGELSSKAGQGEYFSAEFCGGPHVSNTKEIGDGGKRFKIKKQENIGAGMRRIKGALV